MNFQAKKDIQHEMIRIGYLIASIKLTLPGTDYYINQHRNHFSPLTHHGYPFQQSSLDSSGSLTLVSSKMVPKR